jgi:hypothetical protein
MKMSGQLHAPAALTLRETTPGTCCYMRLGGPQSRSERYEGDINLLLLWEFNPSLFSHPACSPDAIPIELSCSLLIYVTYDATYI